MAFDPRSYTVVKCDIAGNIRKRNFFDQEKKTSDLAAFTGPLGGGSTLDRIVQGLNILSKTSDVIRTGANLLGGSTAVQAVDTVINTAQNQVAQGAANVLEAVGIPANTVQRVMEFDPAVAIRAWDQAKVLFDRVKSGAFDISDIPNFQEDFATLDRLASGIYTPESRGNRTFGDHVTTCEPSPYAMDLIAYAPKFKFSFVVQFIWNPIYSPYFKDIEAAFVIKNSTRPNINVEYEDVNMYNFKTKVPKKVTHNPMTMRFYDDTWNQAMLLQTAYLKCVSPISNMDFYDTGIASTSFLEQNAMNFEQLWRANVYGAPTHPYSASYGVPYDPMQKDVFKQINLYHIYREGRLMNAYQFYNPRIETLELDELDMAEGAVGTEAAITFNYDAMHVTTGYDLNPLTKDNRWDMEYLSGSNGRALWPIIFNGAGLAANNCLNTDINVANSSGQDYLYSASKDSSNIIDKAGNLLGQVQTVVDGIAVGRQILEQGVDIARTIGDEWGRTGPVQESVVVARRSTPAPVESR